MYNDFAEVYDLFNEDANYDALFDALHQRLRKHDIADGIVIDLGCGTGELTLRLAEAGYDMIGVDNSEEMLSVLREKAEEVPTGKLLLLHQDLAELDLYGTVRAAVSTFDTLNHLSPSQFARAVCRAALFLEPSGLMLFDMNTPYKHREVLADNTFTLEAENAVCVWRNAYSEAQHCTQISIEVSDEQGMLFHEGFCEYAYFREEIEAVCEKAGLTVLEVVDGEHFGALSETSERFLFTAVKRAKGDTAQF